MASDHADSSHNSSDTTSNPTPQESDILDASRDNRIPSSQDTLEDLVAKAETSPLARKVREKTPEQAIDKPSQEFERKRSVEVMRGKNVDDKHDSGAGGLSGNLRPLTTTNDGVRKEGDGEGGDDATQKSDVKFRKASIFKEDKSGKGKEKRLSSVDPKAVPPGEESVRPAISKEGETTEGEKRESKDSTSKQPTPAEQPSPELSDRTSPFEGQTLGSFYRTALPICTWMEKFDFTIPRRSQRWFEVCDFSFTSDVIRYTCQDILTLEWTRQIYLPFYLFRVEIQPASLAFTAAKGLEAVIREVFEKDADRDMEVFEFCAGSSGPTPTFEKLINQHRTSSGERPILFRISDKYPNLNAWNKLRGTSEWLDFVNIPVDAIDPPGMAMSRGDVFIKKFSRPM